MAQNTTPIEQVWATKGNLPYNAIVATADGKYPALDGSLITNIAGGGDMLKSVYDPSSKDASAFSMGNMDETLTAKILTNTERLQIAANVLKVSNVTTNLSVSRDGDKLEVVSSDGTNAALPLADTNNWGVMSDEMFVQHTENNDKVTNATHTGDVTGDTVLTIEVDAVDIPMLSATGTADGTTFLRGDNTWATPAGGGDVATDAIWDAKGDLAGGTGADAAARLAIGTDGQVLTADSLEATGMKWAAAGGGTVPDASETVRGIVELSTVEETATKGSDRVLTPDMAILIPHFSENVDMITKGATATNGTGASWNTLGWSQRFNFSAATPDGGYVYRWSDYSITRPAMGDTATIVDYINWDNRVVFSCFANVSQSSGLEGGETIFIDYGGTKNEQGNLTNKAIGFRLTGDAIYGMCHDGTTLTISTNTVTMPIRSTRHFMVISDGAGGIAWYIDGVLLEAVSSVAPTGTALTNDTITRYGMTQTGARTLPLASFDVSNPIISILK